MRQKRKVITGSGIFKRYRVSFKSRCLLNKRGRLLEKKSAGSGIKTAILHIFCIKKFASFGRNIYFCITIIKYERARHHFDIS